MTRTLLCAVDLESATQSAAQRIRDISGADYAAVVLADPGDEGNLVYQAGSGLDVRPTRGERLPRKGLAGTAVDTGQAIITPDLTTDPRYSPSPHRRKHLSVLGLTMFLPLNADNEVLGTLLVGWRRDSTQAHLAAREVDLMQTFANQTALVLQRVRTQVDQHRRERWLQAAAQMAELLLGEIDRDQAMRLVVHRLREISGADIAGVMLVDQLDPTSMYVVVFEGIEGVGIPPDTRIPRRGLVEQALQSHQCVVSDDYPHLEGFQPPPEWLEPLSHIGLGVQVPLIAEGEGLGTLFAGWHRGSPRAPAARAEAEQVRTFADLAALALQRVRTQGDRERLMLLEEHDRIAHDLRDIVLQRLFAIGLGLRVTGGMSTDPAIQQRVRQAIDDLDSTNQQIRSTFFGTLQDEHLDSEDLGP
ncbi:GAF domain-containing protein [Actinopolymorpha pittospori]